MSSYETSASALTLLRSNVEDSTVDPSRFHLIDPADERWPFADGTFDAIVSNQVLYFIPERARIEVACREMARVLRPGGKIACTVMAEDNYFFTEFGVSQVPASGPVRVQLRGRIERDYLLYRLKDADELRELFEAAGFVVDDIGYFDFRLLDVTRAKHHIVLARKALT